MSAISTDNQAINTVFVYDIKHRDGPVVLGTPALRVHTNSILATNQLSSQESHTPPNVEFSMQTFYNCMIPVRGQGTEEFDVMFVLYGPPPGGERVFHGECTFQVSIMVCMENDPESAINR